MSNSFLITKKLLDILKVEYTNNYLIKSFKVNPKSNSLLCISNILTKYFIDSKAIKIDSTRFRELPTPTIIQIKKNNEYLFYLLLKKQDNSVLIIDESNNTRKILLDELLTIWTGICLLVEKTKLSNEPGVKNRKKNIKSATLLKGIGALLLVAWYGIMLTEKVDVDQAIYLIINIFGLIISGALLSYEIDSNNKTLKKLCSSGENYNCDSVLKSKYSKLFKLDFLSLSIVGFAYFLSISLIPIFYSFTSNVLSFVSLISLTTLPIIFISLYYQKVVIKKWCKLCLVIQFILMSGALLVIFSENLDYKSYKIDDKILLFASLFLLTIGVWSYLKKAFNDQKEKILLEKSFNKIKLNPSIFRQYLKNQKRISTPTQGLGITFKNKNAKINIVKVCNPYCNPCSKAHPKLEKLVRLGVINLQILFATSINDSRSIPVSHFLALDENEDKNKVENALNDWYSSESKSYEKFAKSHPTQADIESQKEKIKAMTHWCQKENITQTPTIYINNYELPVEYKVDDLIELV